jgi:hypothetical protein
MTGWRYCWSHQRKPSSERARSTCLDCFRVHVRIHSHTYLGIVEIVLELHRLLRGFMGSSRVGSYRRNLRKSSIPQVFCTDFLCIFSTAPQYPCQGHVAQCS